LRALFFLVFLFPIITFAQGLSSGSKFQAIPIYGNIEVHCQSQGGAPSPQIRDYQCEEELLSPTEFDYFVGPSVDADKVELINTFENGDHSSTKSLSYKNGKSTSRVNLWVSSLLQRPLLGVGENSVHYSLSKGSSIVTSGIFKVEVKEVDAKQCPREIVWGQLPNDCDNPYTFCEAYFSRNNYCQ